MSTTLLDIFISSDQIAIRALIDAACQARYDKDVTAIAATYAPHAPLFTLAPPLVHDGLNVEQTQAWLDTWDGPIELEPKDVKITVSGDSAFYYGFLHMTGTKKGPEGKVDFWMRWTVCLERQAGAWKIVHEHASVPFYMDGSLRPAFDLRP